MKKYILIILIALFIIYGCKIDTNKFSRSGIEQQTQQQADKIPPSNIIPKTPEEPQKHASEKECLDYWNNLLSTNFLKLKSSKLFVKFTQDTDIQEANSVLNEFGLSGKPFNMFISALSINTTLNDQKIYDAGHEMESIVPMGKEIETICKLESLPSVISIRPDLTFDLEKFKR